MPLFYAHTLPAAALRLTAAAVLVTALATLAGCGEMTGGGQAPGLVASMDAPGANLDRPTAHRRRQPVPGHHWRLRAGRRPVARRAGSRPWRSPIRRAAPPRLCRPASPAFAPAPATPISPRLSRAGATVPPMPPCSAMPNRAAPASLSSTIRTRPMASTGSSFLPDAPLPNAESCELIDARGLKCPLPVLKLEKKLATLPAGITLVLLATDPMARIDVPLFCRQHGHGCTIITRARGCASPLWSIGRPAAEAEVFGTRHHLTLRCEAEPRGRQ